MTLPKFIICMDGTFRLGMVNQHKHLLKPGDQCIGGGYYHFDFVSNRIILDRESYDFGRPKWHLLEVLKIPSTYRGMRIVISMMTASTMISMSVKSCKSSTMTEQGHYLC